MDEREWLNATDPRPMLEFLRTGDRLSDRKARLFAAACCRRIWHLMRDDRSGRAVEVAERFAEGFADDESRSEARRAAQQAFGRHAAAIRGQTARWERRAAAAAYWASARKAVEAALNTPPLVIKTLIWREGGHTNCDWPCLQAAEQASQAALLRDVFGPLPFRPVPLLPFVRRWNEGAVVRLATAAYEDRELPGGYLDNHRLAVLADALEEAGCLDPDILGHLRQPGLVHTRGCWVVDELLDKR